MADIAALIAELAAVSPDRPVAQQATQTQRLHELTAMLVEADTQAPREFDRFLGVRERGLHLDTAQQALRETYRGKRILVTGGTGCIGTQLLGQLRAWGPKSIESISRGTRRYRPVPGVRYERADVRDASAVRAAVRRSRPDVIFHLAAQRNPGLAERAVLETVQTNVIGTRNVLAAARAEGVARVSHASTGKAMRYFTKDVYAASKKLSEWLLLDYADEGLRVSGSRFTHVVDNSIVLRNFSQALSGGVVRVHDPNIAFYVQSAVESAQLLLLAVLGQGAGLWLTAIRDLGEPVRLLSMALGLIGRSENRPPLRITGYDPGYEDGFQPGLYDPRTASDVSPLVNALEAGSARPLRGAEEIDRFRLTLLPDGAADDVVDELSGACAAGDVGAVVDLLCQAGRRMAGASYAAADAPTLERMQKLAASSGRTLPCAEAQFAAAAAG